MLSSCFLLSFRPGRLCAVGAEAGHCRSIFPLPRIEIRKREKGGTAMLREELTELESAAALQEGEAEAYLLCDGPERAPWVFIWEREEAGGKQP